MADALKLPQDFFSCFSYIFMLYQFVPSYLYFLNWPFPTATRLFYPSFFPEMWYDTSFIHFDISMPQQKAATNTLLF